MLDVETDAPLVAAGGIALLGATWGAFYSINIMSSPSSPCILSPPGFPFDQDYLSKNKVNQFQVRGTCGGRDWYRGLYSRLFQDTEA